MMTKFTFLSFLSTSLMFSMSCYGKSSSPADFTQDSSDTMPTSSAPAMENVRSADIVALGAKKKAVAALTLVAKRQRGTIQEPIILSRLIETLYSTSQISFRVTHNRASREGKRPDLTDFNKTLKTQINYSTQLIQRHPNSNFAARATYLRAKAWLELKNKDKAVMDFQSLLDRFPHSNEAGLATISLADLLIEKKDYNTAQRYLSTVSKNQIALYPMALERLSWIAFYKKDILSALNYAKTGLHLLQKTEENDKVNTGEIEKAFTNISLFYFSGVEIKSPSFPAQEFIPYIRNLKVGPLLSKISLHFMLLLRTKGFEKELHYVKNQLLKESLSDYDRGEIILMTFEYQLTRKQYADMQTTAKDLFKFVKDNKNEQEALDAIQKIRSFIADTTLGLHKTFLAMKNTSEGPQIASTLNTLYRLNLEAYEKDPQVTTKIYYNLGELESELHHYEQATKYYRWVVDNGNSGGPDLEELKTQSSLKAITAQFEALKEKGKIPADLQAKSFHNVKVVSLSEDEQNWIGWIDVFKETPKTKEAITTFRFEANRLLYDRGHLQESLSRLDKFVLKNPQSTYAIPSASLIIDTYLKSESWDAGFEKTTQYIKTGLWKKSPFQATLEKTAGDTSFKIIENLFKEQKFKESLVKSEYFFKAFPNNSHYNTVLEISANSALGLNDKNLSIYYFEQLKGKAKKLGKLDGAYVLTKASFAEERFDYQKSLSEYLSYFKLPAEMRTLPKDQLENLQKKVILYSFVFGASEHLNSILSSGTFCDSEMKAYCAPYKAYLQINENHAHPSPEGLKKSLANLNSADSSLQTLWAAAALENIEFASLKDSLAILQVFGNKWEDANPLFRASINYFIGLSVPKALKKTREKISLADPVQQISLIGEMEGKLQPLLIVPLISIQVSTLGELSRCYRTLAKNFEKLGQDPSAVEVRTSLEKKRDELFDRAYQLASVNGVDDAIYDSLTNGLPQQNNIKTPAVRAEAFLLNNRKDQVSIDFFQKFEDALKANRWANITYLLSEASEKKIVSINQLAVLQSLYFFKANTRAEALALLTKNIKTFDARQKSMLVIPAVLAFYKTQAKSKTKILLEEFVELKGHRRNNLGTTSEESTSLTEAAKWSNADVPANFESKMSYFQTKASPARGIAGSKTPAPMPAKTRKGKK